MRSSALLALLLLPVAAPSRAAGLEEAVSRAPAVVAARARAEAARLRAGSAGRWADPELEGMAARKQTPDEDLPMWEATLRQSLPRWGERKADRARARAAAAMAEADAQMAAADAAADVARMLAERDAALQRLDLLSRQTDRAAKALGALDVRLGAGQGRLADRLALQSRLASLRLMAQREERMARDAEGEIRSRLALDPDAALPAYAAPDPTTVLAHRAPALNASEARRDEARAMADMARAGARPMTALGIRFEREEAEMGDEDTVGVALMTDLPWNSRRYARADEAAARADAEAAGTEADAVLRSRTQALAAAARAAELAEQTRASAAETGARLDREYDALVRAAGAPSMSEDSTVLMVIELMERGTEARIAAVDAELAARQAHADLWRYVPLMTPAGDPP